MGGSREEGVIDRDNRVFGYQNMFVCDGSMISANLGVNPALTITALAERAMSKIPPAAAHVTLPAAAGGAPAGRLTQRGWPRPGADWHHALSGTWSAA
jgi:choline dehydrogenase-like flavoprotein